MGNVAVSRCFMLISSFPEASRINWRQTLSQTGTAGLAEDDQRRLNLFHSRLLAVELGIMVAVSPQDDTVKPIVLRAEWVQAVGIAIDIGISYINLASSNSYSS